MNSRRQLLKGVAPAAVLPILPAAAATQSCPTGGDRWMWPARLPHEHGTCRMVGDAKRSALNGFCRSHEVKNLFVVDGAAFPTATEKNPTLLRNSPQNGARPGSATGCCSNALRAGTALCGLTILALAWRATDHLAAEMEAGRL